MQIASNARPILHRMKERQSNIPGESGKSWKRSNRTTGDPRALGKADREALCAGTPFQAVKSEPPLGRRRLHNALLLRNDSQRRVHGPVRQVRGVAALRLRRFGNVPHTGKLSLRAVRSEDVAFEFGRSEIDTDEEIEATCSESNSQR
ncbi:conserved hypothetical protein [Trichinella spiralis]|uniref:hypothetical protein n=1 Tax=Trichinella spiralis TaxID=6334 RepID=UPI0001EFEBEB|nr:conserved hypothetical protein [Trichinella spiralis]